MSIGLSLIQVLFRLIIIFLFLFFHHFWTFPLIIRGATTILYGQHATIRLSRYIAGEGPRSQQPHAPRIILGPFGVTPRTPNYHRYIIQNLGIQY